MEYEISFVQFYDSSAREIIGPFPDIGSANALSARLNIKLRVKRIGGGEWAWMVARYGETPRLSDCIILPPC